MLRPTKFSNPDSTVISASLLILKILKNERIVDYSELLKRTKKQITGGENLYIPALSFLFIIGRVIYHQKTDSFEYVEHYEAK
ncbi:ABC-three component system middle component 8 [Marinobacter caseinilyticus]|uniref:ABC-three component system middle component 8 n=1 Tax=Marinobacter caseinilyticus TaxID=2692195 RepID=UPI0014083CCF